MFNPSPIQPREEALRLQREELLRQRLWPDSPPRAEWPGRPSPWSRSEEPVQQELLVPDGDAGLYLRDGQPVTWFLPGRHALPDAKGLVEVRLVSWSALPEEAPLRLEGTLELPYERALHFAGGVLVAVLAASYPRGPRLSSRSEAPVLEGRRDHPRMILADDTEGLAQDYSFV